MIEIEFSPPFSYVSIPLDADGQGPADEVDAVSTTHEVWDANCFTVATCGSEETARKIAALLNSSRPSAERSAVGVKDLIWHDYTETGTSPRWKADCAVGEYRIILNTRDMEYWSPQLGGLSVAWDTLEAAKAAAQADYEARILSALVLETGGDTDR